MIRLMAFAAFALVLATSAQAMSLVPLHQSDGMITQVRRCGTGYHVVNGKCIVLPPPEAARCAVGMRGSRWPLRQITMPDNSWCNLSAARCLPGMLVLSVAAYSG